MGRLLFKRFNDLRSEDINFDFQMHTSWTDGHNTPEQMIQQAKIIGLKSIAFTEHVNEKTDWYNGFKEHMEKLRELKENEEINILIGIEAKPIDFNGTLSAPHEALNSSEIILGSVHRYPNGNGGLVPLSEIPSLGREKASYIEYKLIKGLLKNDKVDVIGHPFGVYSKFFTELPEEYLKDIMESSLISGTAIEINTKYQLNQKIFFSLLREINPYISIGSDAHGIKEIARDFESIRQEVSK